MAGSLRVERDGRVMTVGLDTAPRGFMTGDMVEELDALTLSLEGDRSVGALVFTGASPGVFVNHFDLGEIRRGSEEMSGSFTPAQAGAGLRVVGALAAVPPARRLLERTPAAGIIALRRLHGVFDRLNRLDKVVIAAVNGTALGGGCELALACDIRLMATGDHRIGAPEITVGLIPGGGGTQRLCRALGPTRALEMMLEGSLLSPAEALEAGLVHRIVAPGELVEAARETAERMARRSPQAVAALKRAVYEGGSAPLERGLQIERAGFLSVSSSAAARRAVASFDDEVNALADGSPWTTPALYEPWRTGEAEDLVSGSPGQPGQDH